MKTIAPIALILLLSSCIPAGLTTPTSVPTSVPTIIPTKTDILFYDDFSGGSWWVGEDEYGKSFFSDGEYHVLMYQGDISNCYYADPLIEDGVIEIELRQISGGTDSSVGIAFRDNRENNGYLFGITSPGYYTLAKYENNTPTPTILFQTNNESKGIGYTIVTVSMHNNEFDLFVNKTFIGSVKDSAFSSGYVGFCVFPDSSVDTEYAFYNFAIYQYDSSRVPSKPEATPTPSYKTITWTELADFLARDHTNWNQYDPNKYMCFDFAMDLVDNAKKENIKAWIVGVDFTHGDAGHAFVAFETSDKGIIYVEPQADCTYSNLAVGSVLCDDWGQAECMGVVEKITYLECDQDYNCIEYVP